MKSLTTSLYVTAGVGCLCVYWAFMSVAWPPPPLTLMAGIAGIVLVVSAAPALNDRKPWTYFILFVGTCLAAFMGIIFEVALYLRMGL